MKKDSFTIVELIISLTILSIILMLFSTFKKTFNQKDFYSNQINFYQMMVQIEDMKKDFHFLESSSDQIILENNKKEKYILKMINQKLILTTDIGGTMPLLNNLKKFSVNNNFIKVTFSDNTTASAKLLLKNEDNEKE
ncbi:MAG: ComGF family competence protein [Lactobacillaceae bacterium]|nr:ComGF family competence protein [Lactobacillaceae bacterium]